MNLVASGSATRGLETRGIETGRRDSTEDTTIRRIAIGVIAHDEGTIDTKMTKIIEIRTIATSATDHTTTRVPGTIKDNESPRDYKRQLKAIFSEA